MLPFALEKVEQYSHGFTMIYFSGKVKQVKTVKRLRIRKGIFLLKLGNVDFNGVFVVGN